MDFTHRINRKYNFKYTGVINRLKHTLLLLILSTLYNTLTYMPTYSD